MSLLQIQDKWIKTKFSDIALTVNENEFNPLQNGIQKYVGGEHIESENLYVTKFGDIKTNKHVLGSAFHRRFFKGDILFGTRRAYLRKAAIATFDGICANTTLVLRSKNNYFVKELLPFIVHWEKFTEFAVSRSVGSTNPYVRWRDLAAFEFYLPPLNEQKRISELFWSVQKSIDSLEDLIQKFKTYRKSKANDLLTRGIGHTKFKKAQWLFGKEIEIPEGWKSVKIEEVADKLLSGGTPSTSIAEYWRGGIEWTRGATLTTHYLTKGEKLISQVGLKNSSSSVIPKNNLLVVSRVSIGNLSINKIDIAINQDITAIILNSSLCSTEFLYWNLLSNIDILVLFSQGTTIQGFTRKDLSNHILLLPSLQEQQQIASTLTQLDEQYKQLQNHLSLLKKMRKSMINKKLTPPTLRKKIVR